MTVAPPQGDTVKHHGGEISYPGDKQPARRRRGVLVVVVVVEEEEEGMQQIATAGQSCTKNTVKHKQSAVDNVTELPSVGLRRTWE